MKKLVIIMILVGSSISISQEKYNYFSNVHFSLHGGLSFISVKDGWGAVRVEGKTHLSSNTLLKLSLGYTNLTSNNKYEVKTYSKSNINNSPLYSIVSYEVEKTDYEIIPISIGTQYNINYGKITPYLVAEIGYNLIVPVTHKSNIVHPEGVYDSFL